MALISHLSAFRKAGEQGRSLCCNSPAAGCCALGTSSGWRLPGQCLPAATAQQKGLKGLQDTDAQILRLEETTVMNEFSLLHNTGHE